MGRRVPSPAESQPDQERMRRRFTWLARWGLASDPVAPSVQAKADELRRLGDSGLPLADRLAALEDFLRAQGVYEQASAFADRFAAPPTLRGGASA